MAEAMSMTSKREPDFWTLQTPLALLDVAVAVAGPVGELVEVDPVWIVFVPVPVDDEPVEAPEEVGVDIEPLDWLPVVNGVLIVALDETIVPVPTVTTTGVVEPVGTPWVDEPTVTEPTGVVKATETEPPGRLELPAGMVTPPVAVDGTVTDT